MSGGQKSQNFLKIYNSPQEILLIREFVGMINAVAFVPTNEVQNALQELWNHVPHPRLVPLLQYFQDNYVFGPVVPNVFPVQRNPPLFPISLWNKHDVTLAGGCRTNNICEGWNHAFNLAVGQRQPPLYTLLGALQADEANTRLQLGRSRQGNPLRTRVRNAVTRYNNNLLAYCQQYRGGQYQNNMVGYLRDISHNIRYR